MAAIEGEKTLAKPARQFDVPNQIASGHAVPGLRLGRVREMAKPRAPAVDVMILHADIGEPTLGTTFCPERSAKR